MILNRYKTNLTAPDNNSKYARFLRSKYKCRYTIYAIWQIEVLGIFYWQETQLPQVAVQRGSCLKAESSTHSCKCPGALSTRIISPSIHSQSSVRNDKVTQSLWVTPSSNKRQSTCDTCVRRHDESHYCVYSFKICKKAISKTISFYFYQKLRGRKDGTLYFRNFISIWDDKSVNKILILF